MLDCFVAPTANDKLKNIPLPPSKGEFRKLVMLENIPLPPSKGEFRKLVIASLRSNPNATFALFRH